MEAFLTSITAAVEAMFAGDDTNASFHTGMKTTAAPEPALAFILPSGFRFFAWLRQNDAFDTEFVSQLLVIS